MKLWRVLMSVHLKNDTWNYTVSLPTFYVHACTGSDAVNDAIRTAAACAGPDMEYRSSGTVIAVDNNLDPIEDTYKSWSDLNAP
jgi:hypothetical protein